MSNIDAMRKFIEATSGQSNIIAIPRVYIQLFGGDINTALFLSQSVYWSDKTKRTDGYFYKTYSEWEDETGLSEYKIKKATSLLKEKGIIETKIKRANGAPTVHYKLSMPNLQNLIIEFFDNQETSESENEKFQNQKPKNLGIINIDYTKNTQENTVLLPDDGKIFRIYEQEIGGLTPMIGEQLQDIEKDYPDGWFEKAIKAAHKSTTRVTLGYIEAILKRWKTQGIDFQEEEPPKKEKRYKIVKDKDGNNIAVEDTDES